MNESILTRTADTVYAFRFLRLLTTPWNELKAYKLGIIDGKGKVLRKRKTLTTDEEKSAYNLFHRLVFNVKRLLNKIPFGKTTLASYIAALWLLKEHTGMSEEQLRKVLEEATGVDVTDVLSERSLAGESVLLENAPLVNSGEFLADSGTVVNIQEQVGTLFGYKVYSAVHRDTLQRVYVTEETVT